MESVIAAAENGANAVYLGQKRFSARSGAQNFTAEELAEAVRYCHARDIKVHQAVNTILFDDELDAAAEIICSAARTGVDALIIQDLGVFALAKQLCPDMPLHASTQLSVHSPNGALLMQELGFSRVVLARELSLDEIRAIVNAVRIETEVFVHGALCMSLSGQCYLSAMIGSHSANRGGCAGTCRMPFTATGKPDYCLSLKDMCLTDYVGALTEIGVSSLKIEGRMKRPEYTAAAACAYASAAEGKPVDRATLQSVFSRSGFTDGYIAGKTGAHMFGIRQKEDVTAAPHVLHTLQNTYKKVKSVVKADISLHIAKTGEAALTMTDGTHTVTVSNALAQKAERLPLSSERAAAALQKLGGTIFYSGEIRCEIAPGMTLSAAALNAMRREAAEKLYDLRAARAPIRLYPKHTLPTPAPKRQKRCMLRLQFSACDQLPPDIWELPYDVILPASEILAHWDRLAPYAKLLTAEPERALFDTERECLAQLKTLSAHGVRRLLVSNPAHLQMGKQLGFFLVGDSYLNISNTLSARMWKDAGLSEYILSAECTFSAAQRLQTPMPMGFIAYGSYPVMLTRNCPVKKSIGCAKCSRREKLTDRTGAQFPVVCHNRKWSELLNCRPILLSDKWEQAGCFDFAVLRFTIETPKEIADIIEAYENGNAPSNKNFTRGLYYRGVE